MPNKFKKKFLLICAVMLAIFWSGPANAGLNMPELMIGIEQELSRVATENGTCVVSISTEKTSQVVSYFRNFENEIFDGFFKIFFPEGFQSREYNQIALGSGVIIDESGNILTNEHVIAGADKITVTLSDGREFNAVIKGSDHRLDLAVIKIQPDQLPYAKLGNSDDLKPGQWAIAVGNPFGFALQSPKPIITFGVISALHSSLPRTGNRKRSYLDLIQTDAAINPGNSGGPLLNIQGEVIGINVAVFNGDSGYEGIGFAIPINDAKVMLDKLSKGEETLFDLLGIEVQDINPVLADYFGLKKPNGVLIREAVKNTPAEKAGLQPEDIIIKFNNQKVINTLDLLKKIQKTKAGDELTLKIVRNSLPRTIKIKSGKTHAESKKILKKDVQSPGTRPEKTKREIQEKAKSNSAQDKPDKDIWRGLKVSEISREFADNFNLASTAGVIVREIMPGSRAEKAGVRVKDIITQVNSTVIDSLADFYKAVSSTTGNVLIKTNRGYLMIPE